MLSSLLVCVWRGGGGGGGGVGVLISPHYSFPRCVHFKPLQDEAHITSLDWGVSFPRG